jgi:outer membrane protein TolC
LSRYGEQEIMLERAVRWGNKAQLDTQLGAQGQQVAAISLADARHEAGRILLQAWFDYLLAEERVRLLQAQIAVLMQQQQLVAQRVQAGDAARAENLLAEAALASVEQSLSQAQQQLVQLSTALRAQFPGWQADEQAGLAFAQAHPPLLADDALSWQARLVKNNHELLVAQAQAALADTQAERVRAERTPDPSVGVRYSNERAGAEHLAGVYVTLPFAGAARSAAAEQASAEREWARDKVQFLTQRLQIEGKRPPDSPGIEEIKKADSPV